MQRIALAGQGALLLVHFRRVALVLELRLRELDLELLPVFDESRPRICQRLLDRVADRLGIGELRGEGSLERGEAFDLGCGAAEVLANLFKIRFRLSETRRKAIALAGRRVEHALVLYLRVRERGFRIGERLIEFSVSRPYLLQLFVQLGLAGVSFADRRLGVRQLSLERVAGGLRVNELRCELGFALRQTFNSRRRRLVVLSSAIELGLGVGEPRDQLRFALY